MQNTSNKYTSYIDSVQNRGYYTCSTIQLNIGFYIQKIIDRKARKLRYHPNTTNVKMRTKTVGNIPIICPQLVLL